jgi:nitrogen fixation/metabolism regulation signal transduction histidine kinase
MIFKRFRNQLIFRVLLLTATIASALIAFQISEWKIVSITLLLLTILQIVGIIRLVDRSNQEMASFLLAIKYNDFSTVFSPGKLGESHRELRNAFNSIIREFQQIRAQKEAQFHYLQTLFEHVDIALISFDQSGEIHLMNSAANRLLEKPFLKNIHALRTIDQDLADIVWRIGNKERNLYRVSIGRNLYHLAIQATEFKVQDRQYKIVSMQNIKSELDQREIETWQKLIRVLTHEIMNSVTPVISLVEVMEEILEENADQKSIDEESYDDFKLSADAIGKRTKGLVDFVNRYRKLYKVPAPSLEEVDLLQLLRRIEHLLLPEMEEQGIIFSLVSRHEECITRIDPGQIEQVVINLLRNSMDAVSTVDAPKIYVEISLEKARWNIYIRDNGVGINDEDRDKIFIPFFTTKDHGSGIGLSLSRQILRNHNGNISVVSKLGEGSTFKIEF